MRKVKRTLSEYELGRFLGEFAKIAEATIKSRHICLSVRME